MKKKFSKKYLVFGLPLLAVVIVSAALLSYFGVITGDVIVNQGLTVDGHDWNAWIAENPITMYSLENKTVSSGNHQLKNTAGVIGAVKFSSACSATTDGCNDVTTSPVFKLSITGNKTISGQGGSTDQDRVTANGGGIALGGITTLNFDYNLTTTTNGLSPYFVLALDTNDDGVVDVNVVSFQENERTINTWYTYGSSLSFHNIGDCTQANPCDLSALKSTYGTYKVLQVKVMIGYWGDGYPTTALVKNIKVNSVDIVKDNGLIVREFHDGDPDDKTYGDTIVDFSIETYFPKMMKPATYTITTTVVPAA